MKKRTMFSILITVLVLLISNKFWLIFEPYVVSVELGNKNSFKSIQVQLNKKDDSSFKRYKRNSEIIDFQTNTKISVSVPKVAFPKRIRLVLSYFENQNPIIIKSIGLKNNRIKINDFKKYAVEGGIITADENELRIIPQKDTLTITYLDKINARTSIKFDFKLFIIILVLTYLLAYKLSNYVAEFNDINKKSKIEIAFLVVFFIFLFIPASNINQEEISVSENRTLAKWRPLFLDNNRINFEFGKDFNIWFDDRFYLRNVFIASNDVKLFFSRNWKTKNVIKGKENWLFYGRKESIESYSNNKMFTDEELTKILGYLTAVNDYCKKHNKKFYMLIAPDKSKIYEEYYADSIKKVSDISKADQLIKYLEKNSDIKIIYPKDKLISLKKEGLLYWKQDTHWNRFGAYFGYLELINEVKKDYKNVIVFKPAKYNKSTQEGDLFVMSPKLLRKPDTTEYIVPYSEYENMCNSLGDESASIDCNNPKGMINLLMFRDSFSRALIPYLSQSFRKSKYMCQFNIAPKALEDADVIILEMVERNLPNLVNSYME